MKTDWMMNKSVGLENVSEKKETLENFMKNYQEVRAQHRKWLGQWLIDIQKILQKKKPILELQAIQERFFLDSAKPNEDSQLDIDNPYHQKILAFALKTFDSKKIPEALSSKVRFLQLHILSAYQDVYPNDVQFDEKQSNKLKPRQDYSISSISSEKK